MSEEAPAGKARVLVVDDSRVIRIAARKILKDEFDVLEAGDGEEAWETLNKEDDIALVISDLSMPYLDGMGLMKRIRESAEPRLANLPIIIVTGAEDDEEAKSAAFAAGASDFLSKPFDSVQLLAHTRSHVRLVKTETELEQTRTAIEAEPTIDALTGLSNQRAFTEQGRQCLSHALRHNDTLSVILIDVDDFDKAFIKYGRTAGEAILKIFSGIVKDNVRLEDSGGRVGLARFGLLLPSTPAEGARQTAVRICQQIGARAFKIGSDILKLTGSAAVITPEIDSETRFEDLLAEGQKLLGRAAAAGGNRVVFGQAAPRPQPAPTEAPAETPPKPDLASAPGLARAGNTAALEPHLPALIAELMPLLELWNRQQGQTLDDALDALRRSLPAG